MEQLNIALAAIGTLVVLIGVLSNAIKRSVLSEPLIALVAGIVVGPAALGWLDLARWGDPFTILEEAARLTLAVGLMGVALRIDADDLRRLWKPVLVLLTLGMVGMWALSSLVAGAVLGVPLLVALLLGAAVTPTDPIVASAIVTGKLAETCLPRRIRSSLSLESGANDGLAFLLVMLPVLLLGDAPQEAFARWLVDTLLVGILLAVAVGAAIGYGAARLLHWAEGRDLIETYSFLTFSVTLSLLTLGAAELLHANGIIAVFIAGMAFNLSIDVNERHEEENVQEGISKLCLLPILVLFGMALPWSEWQELGSVLPALALLVLLLRRLPVFVLLHPLLRRAYRGHDIAYLGWFGPIGVAALYYAMLAVKATGEEIVWHVASAVIVASVLLHGVTSTLFSHLYARAEGRSPRP